jgi:ankyrin repeat protein
MVKSLLDLDCISSLHLQDSDGNTPIHLAMINCNESQTELLMDLLRVASPEVLDIKDNDGFTPLEAGVLFGRVQNVSAFLISTNTVDLASHEGTRLLSIALNARQMMMAQFLIQAGVDPTLTDEVCSFVRMLVVVIILGLVVVFVLVGVVVVCIVILVCCS